eukprot:GCRY01001679.1.p1 GENE.GCRY01001679.1~~GCRY01001679.1.p1  ORF type:complete len:152 (-),score=18.38 GCRY01001679.1:327-782(-)
MGKPNSAAIFDAEEEEDLSSRNNLDYDSASSMDDMIDDVPQTNSEVEFPKKTGVLRKEGGSIKTWKDRYFKLKNNTLCYYKSAEHEQKGEAQGRIFLRGCSVQNEPDYKKKKFCFSISTTYRRYYITATSEEVRTEWVKALNDSIDLSERH